MDHTSEQVQTRAGFETTSKVVTGGSVIEALGGIGVVALTIIGAVFR